MTIAIVDGLGGGIGAQLAESLSKKLPSGIQLIALGTNGIATQRMIESGAQRGASGENAIRVSIAQADIVIGPIGIVLANSMMGEVSPSIAEAVMNCRGRKILLPLAHSHLEIVGLAPQSVSDLVAQATASILKQLT